MPTAIIVGASSGIGAALAQELAARGYRLGLTARREPLLRQVAASLPGGADLEVADAADLPHAIPRLEALFARLGRVDLFIYCAGVGFPNPDLASDPELTTIDVNVRGFAAATTLAARLFVAQGAGHIVGISSLAALRGSGSAPAYSASKAFMSNYLEGLYGRFQKAGLPITVTDVRPGFVQTEMAKADRTFWMASPEKAARQIAQAIAARRRVVYVTRRWAVIAWLMRLLPARVWARLG